MLDDLMRIIRFYTYGGPEQLVLEHVPHPEPAAGEVLVRVYAAGVNPIDWKIRKGFFKDVRPVPLPFTPGSELAGTVEQLGPGVTGFTVGQAVYGRGAMGAYADYAVVAAEGLASIPHHLSFDQAASVPVGASTAWLALFGLADLHAGQRVLIHGAAGGVGNYAVQLARRIGAHVIGTASSKNLEFVRTLGAETVIDYATTPLEQVVHKIDVVVDPLGGEIQDRSWPLLKPGGILVAVGHPSAKEMAAKYGVRTASTVLAQRVSSGHLTEPLREISTLIESGFLLPQVGKVFPLEEAAQAQALSETGHGRGRIVLHIANEKRRNEA
ncbi:NADPH:quinone reductase [Reticulibacter mediterranei]|uniref:NADPH:quinone reductase n=1 Tax=Reticulibacter mediterranei TaxID=2778369 RepID=A0A8J3J282_9CHLR|nr:NADP-dependent oxidoreductase [Reticulibacter mediterranei]GHP00247.1 NADPH:quinone reductase [Reticulibacter mediterranei]